MTSLEGQPAYVNLDNARHADQRRVMEDIVERGECPFCPENLHKSHKQPILREGHHWVITPNQWPYDHTNHHLLAILRYHAVDLEGLKDGAFDELQRHLVWAAKKLDILAGGVAMRFGSTALTGASVDHLHAHLIEPSKNRLPDQKVRFKIS